MSAGRRLQDSLDPIADGTYSLASGRAALVPELGRVALRGSVGTTPNRGLVWCRKAESMLDYAQVLRDLFEEVRRAQAVPAAGRTVFTELAGREKDLSAVYGAFELGFSGLEVAPAVDRLQQQDRYVGLQRPERHDGQLRVTGRPHGVTVAGKMISRLLLFGRRGR